jgi:hypothetical protein
MKTSTGLTLAAVGAILAFAVHGRLSFVNFNAAGWVIMLVGLAGLFAPPGTQHWLRRRLIVRDGGYSSSATGGAEEESVEEVAEIGESAGFRPADPAGPYVEELPASGGDVDDQAIRE